MEKRHRIAPSANSSTEAHVQRSTDELEARSAAGFEYDTDVIPKPTMFSRRIPQGEATKNIKELDSLRFTDRLHSSLLRR